MVTKVRKQAQYCNMSVSLPQTQGKQAVLTPQQLPVQPLTTPPTGERQWRVLYEKPRPLLNRMFGKAGTAASYQRNSETQIDRYELKYVVHPELVPEIRKFIKPFVRPDKNAHGDPPSYTATTLQIDSINSTLHYAKTRDVDSRFKLRIRTYGFDGNAPYFLELKRKIQSKIYKSRAILKAKDYCKEAIVNPTRMIKLAKESENDNYLEFVRLTKAIGGIPAIYVRYERECYAGLGKEYSRITFDRNIRYRPARTWDFPLNEKRWYPMDQCYSQRLDDFSGYILELKTTSEMPHWMAEVIERFNLVQTGFCKYSTAMWLESLYRGHTYSNTSEETTPFENASDF